MQRREFIIATSLAGAALADPFAACAQQSAMPIIGFLNIELYVNLKNAKALGINVPLRLSGRADELFA